MTQYIFTEVQYSSEKKNIYIVDEKIRLSFIKKWLENVMEVL